MMNGRIRFLMGVVMMIAIHGAQISAREIGGLKFENAPGWVWRLKPNGAGTDWSSANTDGLAMRLDELKSGKLLLSIAHTLDSSRTIARFRPVAFDAAGQRFEFLPDSGGSTEGVALEGFTLDLKSLPREQVKYLGLEQLSRDNLRDVVAPAAYQRLKSTAATIAIQQLPWPNVLAPTSKDERELWATACDTDALPRLLLIGRDGVVVQVDCPPRELEQEIQKLLSRK